MSLSPEDAAIALEDVKRAQARSRALYDYQASTPYWIMWGILWIAGSALNQVFPAQWFITWAAVCSIGFPACLAPKRAGNSSAWRGFGLSAVLFLICYAIGYRAAGLYPRHVDAAFFWLASALGIGSSLLVLRIPGLRAAGGWRLWAVFAAVSLSYAAVFAIVPPVRGGAAEAAAPLLLATVFVLWGIYAGTRYVAVGLTIAVLTLIGYYTIHQHFALWVAAVCSGSLVLTGLWMRRI